MLSTMGSCFGLSSYGERVKDWFVFLKYKRKTDPIWTPSLIFNGRINSRTKERKK